MSAAEATGFGFFAPTPPAAGPPLAAAAFTSPPAEERAFGGLGQGEEADRLMRGLLSPTLPKAGEGEPIASCSGPPEARDVQARPSPAGAGSPAPARLARHILLVEDDSMVLEFSTTVLVRGGYQVTGVEDCEAAWEALQSARYDLLVTDNQMPGMSGLELVGKLRSAQIGLPIIVASGGIEAEEFAQNQSLQPAIALPKPFTAEQLLESVAESLRRAGRDPAHTEVSFYASSEAYSHWGLNE
jgi:CheY-like chemotaxis protein